MAEGLLRSELQRRGLHRQVKIDSAGTHAAQPGRPVDSRAVSVCARHGLDIRKTRARQIRDKDFDRFDYILAMDSKNLGWLMSQSAEAHRGKFSMIGSWARYNPDQEIPDPYYGNMDGFEHVFEMLQASVDGFANSLVEILAS